MALPKHGIETSLREFFKATIAGGLLFLLPVVLILIVLRHAMKLAVKFTKPISDLLPVEAVLGIRRETFLAVLLLIFISLVAGLVAKTNAGRRFIRWCENSFLGGPWYAILAPATHATSPVPPATPVAMATARMHVNSYSRLLDEAFGLHGTSLEVSQRAGISRLWA